jgi:hypothetical protein
MPRHNITSDKLYDNFGIEFIQKDGVNTHFKINKNDSVDDNIEDVMKILCLFTVGLFETDSIERQIIYKRDKKFYRDTVDNMCMDFFTKCDTVDNQIELPETSKFFMLDGEDEESVECFDEFNSELKNVNFVEDYESGESDDTDESGSGLYNLPRGENKKYFQKKVNSCPVSKIKIKKDKYTSCAKGSADDIRFWNFSMDNSVEVDKVYDVLDDAEEVAGNWGAFLEHKNSKEKNSTKKEIIFEERFSIFDFDKFDIIVNSDKKQKDPKYTCSFTPIKGIHHAASMIAQSCTVDYTMTDVTIELVNSVSIELTPKENKYEVITTYYGIDVL